MQRAAVLWMQARERASGPLLPHPTIKQFRCAAVEPGGHACFQGIDDPIPTDAGSGQGGDGKSSSGGGSDGSGRTSSSSGACRSYQPGLPFWGDTATGELHTEAPPVLCDSPGGLFCDEPGLGKTITGVSGG